MSEGQQKGRREERVRYLPGKSEAAETLASLVRGAE